MWQTLNYKLTSDSPLIMHSGRTANPLDPMSKALKAISGKRVKTDADHAEMARLEFLAGLYWTAAGPVIPAANIDAMLINAARKSREGSAAQSGVFCQSDAIMGYTGPRTTDELWADERFRHVAIVRVQTARVVRTRPIFHEWTATVTVQFEDSVINASRVDEWFHVAGRLIGLGDWRPKFGRFSVERLTE